MVTILSEMEDDEDDVLGKADDVRLESRLGCQAFVGTTDVRFKYRVKVSMRLSTSILNTATESATSLIDSFSIA